MRRVLWGSQHIGEATPGLIKSKKAKQKVKTINFLWFFSHKYLKRQSCFSCHSRRSCLSSPSCLNCPWHFSPGVVAKWLPKWPAWKFSIDNFYKGLGCCTQASRRLSVSHNLQHSACVRKLEVFWPDKPCQSLLITDSEWLSLRKVGIKLLGQLKIDFFHPNLSDCEDVWSSDLDLCHLLASLPCILHLLICWPGHHEEMVIWTFLLFTKELKNGGVMM